MSNNVVEFPANPRAMGAIRNAVKERAQNIGASEQQRLHALGVAFNAVRLGASPARAIAEANADLRPRRPIATDGFGPEAA